MPCGPINTRDSRQQRYQPWYHEDDDYHYGNAIDYVQRPRRTHTPVVQIISHPDEEVDPETLDNILESLRRERDMMIQRLLEMTQ